jgi:hypothetical protein
MDCGRSESRTEADERTGMNDNTYPKDITYNRNELGVQTRQEVFLVVQSRYRQDNPDWRDIEDFPQQYHPPITEFDRGVKKGFKTLQQAIEAIEISKRIRALKRPYGEWSDHLTIEEWIDVTWEYRVIERTITTHNQENTLFQEAPLVAPE